MSRPGSVAQIAPADVFERLVFEGLRDQRQEMAVLDVREEGRFGEGHILLASALPLSRLEVGIASLVPRKTTLLVVYDDNDGLSERACSKLFSLGYTGVCVLDGGLASWSAAGFEVYSGLNTPSKALGVFAHRELAIPEIGPDALAGMVDSGKSVAVFDCRPFSEYQNGCIPGAMSCPGAQLVAAAPAAARGADTLVINCAGRTRGLVGARTLLDFGTPKQVFALRDGTMGWQLTGRAIERNGQRYAVAPSAVAAGFDTLARAQVIREAAAIGLLDARALASMQNEVTRTTYLFDVREKREYDAGHIAGAQHVAGGQLVQNLDMHVATQGSRIVVSDGDGISATGIALWLRRLGWVEVFVARIDDGGFDIRTSAPAGAACGDARFVDPSELKALIDAGRANVVDLASSRDYRKGHIPGAWFVVRSRLAEMLPRLPEADHLVLTSQDGLLAAFAARDELRFPGAIHVLAGGTSAWVRAGHALSSDLQRLVDVPDDVVLKPSELPEGPERDAAMREYLGGSEELLAKVEREGLLRLTALEIG